MKEDIRLYNYLRSYLYKIKGFTTGEVETRMSKLFRDISVMETDDSVEEYMRRYFIKNNVVEDVLELFKDIDITTTNIKLESQYKTIKDFIDIINDIWVNEKAKEKFIKYIIKSQGSVSGVSGVRGVSSVSGVSGVSGVRGVSGVSGARGVSSASGTDRREWNSVRGGANLAPILKIFRRVLGKHRQQSTMVMSEQISVLNKYKRSNNTNFQNIYEYISLLCGYILEVDVKMRERFKKEYYHLYDKPKPLYNDNLRQFVEGSSPKLVSPKVTWTTADIALRKEHNKILNSHLEFNFTGDLKDMRKLITNIENNFGIET
jgi:hypothetical protein